MDFRTRFMKSILGGKVDRFVRYEHGMWPSTRERWLKEGLPENVGCYFDSPEFISHFRFDPLTRIEIKSGYVESPYYPGFQRETMDETGDHITYKDTDGVLKKTLKVQSDTSMPQFMRFPVANRQDWNELKKRLDPADSDKRIGDITALARACADETVPTMLPMCGAFGHPRNLFGDEGLSYVLYDDPELLEEILTNWYELYARLIRDLTARIRIDSILIWEDMCYKTGPLIDPMQFRRFMLPHYGNLIMVARGAGVGCVIVDSDGDVLKMIPLFLEAGVDCLMPFEVQAGMDVVAIRKKFGDSFCIMGGIDKRALAYGREAIEAEVNRVVPFFINSGRFIPTLDHTVPTNVSLESYRQYLQCLRSFERGER